jgi:hypothetical protein
MTFMIGRHEVFQDSEHKCMLIHQMPCMYESGQEWKRCSGNGRENVQWLEIRLRLQELVVRIRHMNLTKTLPHYYGSRGTTEQ